MGSEAWGRYVGIPIRVYVPLRREGLDGVSSLGLCRLAVFLSTMNELACSVPTAYGAYLALMVYPFTREMSCRAVGGLFFIVICCQLWPLILRLAG